MGSSANGSYLYLVANGDLDGEEGPATRGNCRTPAAHGGLSNTSGACNLYLLHEGKARLIGRVSGKDALDWTGSVLGIFASCRQRAQNLLPQPRTGRPCSSSPRRS